MRSIGIGAKLVGSFAILLAIVCGGLSYVSYHYASEALMETIEAYVRNEANDAAESIESKMKYYKDAIHSLSLRNAVTGMNWDVQAQYLKKEQSFYGFKALAIATPDGKAKDLLGAETDVSGRAYFKDALAGKIVSSDIQVDKSDNALSCMVAAPISANGKVVGVAIGIIDGKDIINAVTSKKIGKAGNSFMLNKKGDTVAHDDLKLVYEKDNDFESVKTDPALAELVALEKKMVAGEKGIGSYSYKGNKKFLGYAPVQDTDWSVATAAKYSDVFAGLVSLYRAIAIGSIIVLIAGSVAALFLARTITVPIVRIMTAATAIASGNLNARSDTGGRRDEIGKLDAAIAKMVDMLLGKMKEAEDQARIAKEETARANIAVSEAEEARKQAEEAKRQGMLEAAQQLERIVEQLSSASEELSVQVEQSSRGTEEQSSRTSEAATAMDQMTASVTEVARNASDAAGGADTARGKAQSGAQEVRNAIAAIFEVKEKSKSMMESLSVLGGQAQSIGAIMNVIDDIADQTNLLALNAAIEAARAGDAGRGFAVVADEVRKLAEKTMMATKEVGDAIKAIQEGTRLNVNSMASATQAVETSTTLAERAGGSLTEIVSLVDVTADRVRSIATASEEQSAASEEINRSFMEISRISSETANAMGQSTKAISELARLSASLKEMIDAMKSN